MRTLPISPGIRRRLSSLCQASGVALLILAGIPALAQNQAVVTGHCLSFQLHPMVRQDPTYGVVTAYFTSYMGSDLFPPQHDVSGSEWIFSLEVKPLPGQPGVYMTDYLSVSSISGLFQYGHLRWNLPTTDTDANGVPDFLQRDLGVSASFSGVQTVIYPVKVTVNVSGSISRRSGQVQGDISFNNGIDHPGTWSIPNLAGFVTYTRGADVAAKFNLTGTKPDGSTHAWAAEVRGTVGSDGLSLPAFTLTRDDNTSMRVAAPFAMPRKGSRLAGSFQVIDGLAGTTWSDFSQWVLQIFDPTDFDGDGIPDIVDAPERPSMELKHVSGSTRITLKLQPAYSYTLRHSPDLKTWSTVTYVVAASRYQEIRPATAGSRGFYKISFP